MSASSGISLSVNLSWLCREEKRGVGIGGQVGGVGPGLTVFTVLRYLSWPVSVCEGQEPPNGPKCWAPMLYINLGWVPA